MDIIRLALEARQQKLQGQEPKPLNLKNLNLSKEHLRLVKKVYQSCSDVHANITDSLSVHYFEGDNLGRVNPKLSAEQIADFTDYLESLGLINVDVYNNGVIDFTISDYDLN